MLKYFLICQCATLLISFEGIVCPFLDFVIKNFAIADIYDEVEVPVTSRTGRFIFKKGNGSRQRIVQFSNIKRQSVHQEGNDPTVVSFVIRGGFHVSHNIKFEQEWQAKLYAASKVLPDGFGIAWARVYTNWRPVIMMYDEFDDGDIGFKFLKNDNYDELLKRLHHLPYVFKRSDIDEAVRTTPRQTLYLRNKARTEDYEISFLCQDDMEAFLRLFPNSSLSEDTNDYYFMP